MRCALFAMSLLIGSVSAARAMPQKKAAAVAMPAQPVNRWPDEQFSNWYFNQFGGSADRARQQFDSTLTLQIDAIDRAAHLSAEQKAKLRMIGHGEIKRVFDNFEQAKARFNELDNDTQKLAEVLQEFGSPQQQGGPFGETSVFFKSMRHTLNAEQWKQLDAVERERRAYRHRAQIELAVGMLDQTMPLRDEQRRAFLDLLARKTKPARSFQGVYDYYVLMYQIGQIPETEVKPIFSETQWKVLQQQIDQYRQILPNLRRSGYLIEDDDSAEEPPPKK